MKAHKVRSIVSGCILVIFASIVSAIPLPLGVDGIIYELDGITQVPAGIPFYVHDLSTGETVSGTTGAGSSGRYSVALSGNIGDSLIIKAWNKYNSVNLSVPLSGVMHKVNLYLNMSYPPLAPAITSSPVPSVNEDEPYEYQVAAFDENSQDTLTYSLKAGPPGMSINGTSGRVQWSPGNQHTGNHSVIVLVSDGIHFINQSFVLHVININDPPMIVSLPPRNATQDVVYNYQLVATDIDSPQLTYTLLNFPAGMVINASTGHIRWTPTKSQVNTHTIIVEASDGRLADSQTFTLSVSNVNDLPVITSLPPTHTLQGQQYNYEFTVEDYDNDYLIYSLINAPSRMTLNKTTKTISWTPANEDVRTHQVSLKVADNEGFVIQPFVIIVDNINDAPIINSSPLLAAEVGKLYLYDVNGYDIDNDTLTYSLILSPQEMAINPVSGIITWRPRGSQTGTHSVIVNISDSWVSVFQKFNVSVSTVTQEEEDSLLPAKTLTADSSGGGSGGGGLPLTLSTERKESPENIPSAEDNSSKNAVILQEHTQRPASLALLSRPVYKYLSIEGASDEMIQQYTLNFSVPKDWLLYHNISAQDIVLAVHTSQGWQDEIPAIEQETKQIVVFSVPVIGARDFAVSVKEGIMVTRPFQIQTSSIKEPFTLSGIIYEYRKKKEIPPGTIVHFTNLNTSELISVKTGIGPHGGGYAVVLHGALGHILEIRLDGSTKSFQTELANSKALDFEVTPQKGLARITGHSIAGILPTAPLYATLAGLIILSIGCGIGFWLRKKKP